MQSLSQICRGYADWLMRSTEVQHDYWIIVFHEITSCYSVISQKLQSCPTVGVEDFPSKPSATANLLDSWQGIRSPSTIVVEFELQHSNNLSYELDEFLDLLSLQLELELSWALSFSWLGFRWGHLLTQMETPIWISPHLGIPTKLIYSVDRKSVV